MNSNQTLQQAAQSVVTILENKKLKLDMTMNSIISNKLPPAERPDLNLGYMRLVIVHLLPCSRAGYVP